MLSKKRKTEEERIAEAKARIAVEKAKLDKLTAVKTAKERRREARRQFLIGQAILGYIAAHSDAKERLAPILDEMVSKPIDRELLTDLLPTRPRASGQYEVLKAAVGK
jgi:hypothetical protein